MKTKESIAAYNKEYFARPEVIARAKVRNAERRYKRALYKKTARGKEADRRYKKTDRSKDLQNRVRLKTRYGITPEDYDRMFKEQRGQCAICEVKKDKLDIDHCHNTKVVRGLLCGSCNRALGLMKDNKLFLLRAIRYLM